MKIEAGKQYRLRNGDTAYIYEVDVGLLVRIAGKVTDANGDVHITSWYNNGKWLVTDRDTNPWDIIGPVCENRKEFWFNTYTDGFMSDAYKTQAEADAFCLKRTRRGRIKVVWEDNKIVNVEWSNV
jgi:hypothetical protein